MNLHNFINAAKEYNASDLYIISGQLPIMRVNGDLKPIPSSTKLTNEQVSTFIHSIMSEAQFKEYCTTNDYDFSILFEDTRFRVNAFKTLSGTAAVFRYIPSKIQSIDELNLPTVIKNICSLNKGLVLVTGPTGSGKSTTLSAMVNHINENFYKHIITIEDPIEFIHNSKKSLINQREVKTHTASFAQALRSALRESPDIILVGELRDFETISLALTAAETGHLVIATMHTNSAPKAIDRILDSFPEGNKDIARTMLSSSLQAVITQLLVKNKSNSGRIAVHEILIANSAIRNLIRENKIAQITSTMQINKKAGMQTFKDAANELFSKNLIDEEQVKQILNEVNATEENSSPQQIGNRNPNINY